jgi:hypothetical protein
MGDGAEAARRAQKQIPLYVSIRGVTMVYVSAERPGFPEAGAI